MPRCESNSVWPRRTMRPRCGRSRPANMFTSEVLPAPERPNSAVIPAAWQLKLASSLNSPRRCETRSKEHTSELQSLLRLSYGVFCLKHTNGSRPQEHVESSPDPSQHL